jgi:hypothetical protein
MLLIYYYQRETDVLCWKKNAYLMVNKQNREKQVEVKVMGISLSPLRAIFQ